MVLLVIGVTLLVVGICGYFLTASTAIEDYVEAGLPIFWLMLILIALLLIATRYIGKEKLLIVACIFFLIAAIIQIPITNGLANPPHEGPPMILSWGIQSGTRTPIFWVNAIDVNDDITAMIIELRNQTSGAVYSNTSYAVAHTQALAPHSQINVSMRLNLSDMGVPATPAGITVMLLLMDESGKYSSPREEAIQIPA